MNSDEEGGGRREMVNQVARLGTQVLSEFEDDEQRTMRSREWPTKSSLWGLASPESQAPDD